MRDVESTFELVFSLLFTENVALDYCISTFHPCVGFLIVLLSGFQIGCQCKELSMCSSTSNTQGRVIDVRFRKILIALLKFMFYNTKVRITVSKS